MGLPKAVESSAKKADELIKSAGVSPTPQPAPIVAKPAIELVKEEEPKPPENLPPAAPESGEDIKAKYEQLQQENTALRQAQTVLQGKYNAEVPRLYQEIEALKQPSPEPEPKTSLTQDIAERLKKEYGEDFIKDIEIILADKAKATVEPIKTEINMLKDTAIRNSEQAFISDLTRLVSDWQVIAKDPGFAVFLSETDRFTGFRYYDLAASAQKQLDAPRLAEFYNAYKERLKSISHNPPSPKPLAKTKADLVAPGGVNRTDEEPGQTIYISRNDIQQFYNEVARGLWNGKEKEKKEQEAIFYKALQEHRVV